MKRRQVIEGVAASIALSIGVGSVSATRGVSEQSVENLETLHVVRDGEVVETVEDPTVEDLRRLETDLSTDDTLTESEEDTSDLSTEDTLTDPDDDTLTELEADTLTDPDDDTLTSQSDEPITDPKDPITGPITESGDD